MSWLGLATGAQFELGFRIYRCRFISLFALVLVVFRLSLMAIGKFLVVVVHHV